MREVNDKSNGVINQQLAFLFNDWVKKWGLMEISISTRCFIWRNNQDDPIFLLLIEFFVLWNGTNTFLYLLYLPFLELAVTMPL